MGWEKDFKDYLAQSSDLEKDELYSITKRGKLLVQTTVPTKLQQMFRKVIKEKLARVKEIIREHEEGSQKPSK